MKYQIKADILFNDEADAEKLYKEIEKFVEKAYKKKGTEIIPVSSICQKWECYHDETPPKQCKKLKFINFEVA